MRLDERSCFCPFCGETLLKKNCAECSHKDMVFEGVCFCPRCESFFMQEEPPAIDNNTDECVIFPEWQAPKKRLYQ